MPDTGLTTPTAAVVGRLASTNGTIGIDASSDITTRTLRHTVDAHSHECVIQSDQTAPVIDWRELWTHRELLWNLARRDLRVRFKQTLLGPVWSFLQPCLSLLMYTIVFGFVIRVPTGDTPYPVFVLSGMILWQLFQACVNASTYSWTGASALIRKIYVPRLYFPLASLAVPIADFLAAALFFGLVLGFFRYTPEPWILAIPLLVVLTLAAALGLGLIVGCLSVRYRDFLKLMTVMLQLFFYASAVLFPPSLIPTRWHPLLAVNPMFGIVMTNRAAILGDPFSMTALAISSTSALVLLLVGLAVYRRCEGEFADVI